ncbi:MAG: NifU family protein [Methylovirgula sp.]
MLAEPDQTIPPVARETDTSAERIAIIKEVLEEIRPNLKRDGGDCEFICIDGNKIIVRMTGACVFCKLASMTIEGIQSKIVERLGVLVRVVPAPPGYKAPH